MSGAALEAYRGVYTQEHSPVRCLQTSSLTELFKCKIGQQVGTDARGRALLLKEVIELPAPKAAGTSPQIMVVLEAPDGQQHRARVKATQVNEAINYSQLFSSNDPLKVYLPPFYGVCGPQGHFVDARTLQKSDAKERNYYLLLEDVMPEGAQARDFKFCKTPGLLNNSEHVNNNPNLVSVAIIAFKHRVLSLCSQFSFVLSAPRGGMCRRLDQILSALRTKHELEKILGGLTPKDLQVAIQHLKDMQRAIQDSKFACSDASLLFILPVLSIHFIDLAQAVHETEGVANFAQIKRDAVAALGDLIQWASHLEPCEVEMQPVGRHTEAALGSA